MLFLRKFPANIRTFSSFFYVKCVLREKRCCLVCAPCKRGCFFMVDIPLSRSGFCQPSADKRPSIFSACYNCFFPAIPLK